MVKTRIRHVAMVAMVLCLLAGASSASGQQAAPAAAPGPARPKITGISHVAFRVSDATAARRFYGELLGLSEGAAPPAARGAAVYAVGHRQHVLIEPGLPPQQDERLLHLAFQTADVEALRRYLTARGVDVQQPPERCEPGAIRVTDPDGHVIEFVQVEWPPRPAPSASSGSNHGERALSTRMLHAGLTIRDEEAAHRFYRDILGFSEIWRGGRTDEVTDWVNMRVPDGTEYLEYMLVRTPPDRQRLGSLHHLCLLVPDIQAAWEEAARRVVTAPPAQPRPTGPNVGRNGRWQLNLFDPDGTRTELMEPFRIR
jgi:catechol 2,3-dioxygenase-like lactoylglutathione lyase family enzyme